MRTRNRLIAVATAALVVVGATAASAAFTDVYLDPPTGGQSSSTMYAGTCQATAWSSDWNNGASTTESAYHPCFWVTVRVRVTDNQGHVSWTATIGDPKSAYMWPSSPWHLLYSYHTATV